MCYRKEDVCKRTRKLVQKEGKRRIKNEGMTYLVTMEEREREKQKQEGQNERVKKKRESERCCVVF
jgi:hypothetical protein